MSLSTELISQFVKATKDTLTTEKNTTIYGTVIDYGDTTCVQLDGSEEITPVVSTASIKAGERVVVSIQNHTATVTGNVTDPSASSEEVEGVKKKMEDQTGAISEIIQEANSLASRVQDNEEAISEIEQTAGMVRVSVTDSDGNNLSTYITAEKWEALRKNPDGEITSGFYFDFTLGRFVYDGSGVFRSEDGSAYIQVNNDGISLYANKGDGEIIEKIRVGFTTDSNVDYPYVLLGNAEVAESAGLIKKFWDGLFIGNALALDDNGYFSAKNGYAGMFIDTLNCKSYVVQGTDMKNLYTGAAIAKFK